MNEKTYHFIDDGSLSESIEKSASLTKMTVTIQEDLSNAANDNYGCYTWICAPVLAQFVWHRRRLLKGRRVLEIGAGAALPGIVAGLCGDVSSLTFADSQVFHPVALRLSRRNADANGLERARVIDVTWGLVGPEMMDISASSSSGYDVILASDCFYDTHNFDDVVFTIATLLQLSQRTCSPTTVSTSDSLGTSPTPERERSLTPSHARDHVSQTRSTDSRPPELWMTYQERSSGRSIRHLLEKYGLTCVEEISWTEFYESNLSEMEKANLKWLNQHHQIHSVWILVVREDALN